MYAFPEAAVDDADAVCWLRVAGEFHGEAMAPGMWGAKMAALRVVRQHTFWVQVLKTGLWEKFRNATGAGFVYDADADVFGWQRGVISRAVRGG